MLTSNLNIDDLKPGLSRSFTVKLTVEQIESFAKLTGDFHPLHMDHAYAIRSGFKDVLAHGALITSLSSRLIGMELPGLRSIVLSQESKYFKPTYPGDELTFNGVVSKLRKSLSIVIITITVVNQDDEEVSLIEFTVKLRGES